MANLHTYHNGKFFGVGLSIHGESLDSQYPELHNIFRLLEHAFIEGQKFKSKQLERILHSDICFENKYKAFQGTSENFIIEGYLETYLFDKQKYTYEHVIEIAYLMQKVFDAGQNERAETIRKILNIKH